MGQSNSQPTTPRGPPPRPKEPPSAQLTSKLGYQGPKYYQPGNRVLPDMLPDIKDVKLRPVSQELSQYHPDFKNIFQNEDDNGNMVPSINNSTEVEADKENLQSNGQINGANTNLSGGEVIPNGAPYNMNGEIINGNSRVHADLGSTVQNGDLRMRPQSVIVTPSGKIKGHRRQVSASSSLYTRENTIIEDPAESLDHRGKIDPISMDTSFSSQVSIPVKNTFDLDRSYNLTYAQLAEARRNKTLLEQEKKTGRKIEDLSAELSEFANDGSEFTRQPSTRSAKSAASSKSVDSGLKKKKRAPPPPTQQPPPPPTSSAHAPPLSMASRSISTPAPSRPSGSPAYRTSYSAEVEPPVDYDDDVAVRSPVSVTRSQSVRSAPAVNVRAPPPPPNAPPPPPLQGILRKTQTRPVPERPKSAAPLPYTRERAPADNRPQRTQSFKSPPVQPPAAVVAQPSPFLLEIQKKAEEKALRRQFSEKIETNEEEVKQSLNDNDEEKSESFSRSISESQDGPNLVYSSAPNTPRNPMKSQENEVPNSPLRRQNSSDTSLDTEGQLEGVAPPVMNRQNSTTSSSSAVSSNDPSGAVRRLNSLLQHDIKIAAQAKATKIVKHTTPVKEKPKDPAQVFREQLQKAAAEREERVKRGETIDSILQEKQRRESAINGDDALFKTDEVVVKRVESIKKESEKPKAEISIDKEELDEFPRPKFVKKDSVGKKKGKSAKSTSPVVQSPRQRLPDSDEEEEVDYRASVYSTTDWTPEVDLSDDDLSETEAMTSKKGQTEGFKTSIVPGSVNDLKSKKDKKVKGKQKDKRYKKSSDSSADEKRKFDSIKRFKKSVHKGVVNAFGSISKASGKILKKNKSEELFTVEDAPKNWKLEMSSSQSLPNFENQQASDKAFKYLVPNGYADHKSDKEESSEDESYLESSISADSKQVEFSETNGRGGDNEESDDDDDDEESVHTMKRAGVAYINKHGQVVLLPEYETVKNGSRETFEGRAPKIHKQKKKFAFDATVRRKEKEVLEERLAAEVLEKEQAREEEKRKEKETEMELKRIRELEARDRLQRLELQAQMQQQLLQQQQQHQYGLITAPPLPPPTGFQQGYNPAAMDWSLPGVPYGSQATFNGPMFNAGVPGMTYDFSEYMRMMGMQGGQTNPQQYAFTMNTVPWHNPAMDATMMNKNGSQLLNYSAGKLPVDDSQRNQVYQAWVGPTKQPASNISNQAQKYVVNDSDNTSVPGNMQYEYGANTTNSNSRQRTNPLYVGDSDASDGLSPQKAHESMVARIQVGDFRAPSSVNGSKEEEAGLFKSSISVPNLSSSGHVIENGGMR